MASFICHVVGGTKRVRVERTVRQQSSPHDDRRSSHAVCARRSRRGVLPGMTPQRREKEVSHGCCSSTLRLAATLRAPILWPLTPPLPDCWPGPIWRSEEHTSELQSLMRISYAVFCLKK